MKRKPLSLVINAAALAIVALIIGSVPLQLNGQTKGKTATAAKTTTAKATVAKPSAKPGKAAKPGKSAKPAKRTSKTKQSAPAQTSREVKRQEEAARQEITKTKAEIAANDKSISQGVSNLRRLEVDIESTRQEVQTISGQVTALRSRIGSLEADIQKGQEQLDLLRSHYLQAVKKMRIAKKKKSDLAFIFSAKSFSEAMRRIRYIKEFSAWREARTKEINAVIARLDNEKQLLTQTRSDCDAALGRQMEAQQKLQAQHTRQDAIIVQLRKNGDALRAHLARKQNEANQLRNRVSALIAQEEAKRVENERRKAEEAKRQAEAKRRQEEQQRQAAAAQAQARQSATPAQEQKPVATTKPAKPAKEKQPGKTYADARKRKPRSENTAANTPTASVPPATSATPTKTAPSAKPSVTAASGFEQMRGSLPRPVAGAFKVVSPFGRQSSPDLPDVVYDNPGIDAEVAKGASAQAVYGGEVSGVYMLSGFSTVVIISHGNYYTVYGNIASPSVKQGDKVKQGQTLGKLAVDADNPSHSTIHFEVWKKREKLNPMSWIR